MSITPKILRSNDIQMGAIYIYALIFSYAVLSIVFGGAFYRLNLFNITSSEVIVVASILWFIKAYPRALFFNVSAVFYLLYIYWLAAIVFSILLERDIYFVLRQSVHLFYFLIIPVAAYSLVHLKRDRFFEKMDDTRYLIVLVAALFVGLAVNSEHMDGAFVVLIILFTLFRLKSLALSIGVTLLYVMMTGHASHKLAIIIYFCVVMYFNAGWMKPIVLVLAIFSIVILGTTPVVMGEFSDSNAVWRYLYWKDLILYMFDDIRVLTGIGYGEPYMRFEYDNFYLLSSQVDSGKGDYQLFTVPPHNSFLAILYHLGIIPATVILVFMLKTALISKNLNNIHEFAAMLAVLVIMLTHNGLELPYMALLLSYVIAIVLSSNYLKEEELERGKKGDKGNAQEVLMRR